MIPIRIYPKAIIWLLKSNKFVPIPISKKLYIIIDISEWKRWRHLFQWGRCGSGNAILGAFLYYCYGVILYFLWFQARYNGVACREWSKIVVKNLNRTQFCKKYEFSPQQPLLKRRGFRRNSNQFSAQNWVISAAVEEGVPIPKQTDDHPSMTHTAPEINPKNVFQWLNLARPNNVDRIKCYRLK